MSEKPHNFTHFLDEARIRELYITKGLSVRECGEAMEVSSTSMFRTLKRLGIPIRGKSEQKRYKNAIILDRIGADRWYLDGTPISDLVEWSGLDVYSVRLYLTDKGLRIRSVGEAKAIFGKRQREAREERAARRVSESTYYIKGGKLIVKYDETGAEVSQEYVRKTLY